MRRMHLNTMTLVAIAAFLFVIPAWAAEISLEQAGRAAKAWVDRGYAMGRLPAGRSVAEVEEIADTTTGAELRIVRLEGGGFVVTSADDLVEPVIAFSETGDGVDTDEANPFWALLRSDIAAREAAAGVSRRPDGANAQRGRAAATEQTEAQRRWADLLGEGSAISRPRAAAAGRSSLSNVLVASFVKSKWSQSTAGGKNCWNYYTPSNYVCGCVATAFGQVMRYWKYPMKAVEAKTKTCAVDGEDAGMKMFGGTYYWNSMPLAPSNKNPPSEEECQAIGKLVYDIGVSVRMDWGYDGSGAVTLEGASALKNDFGYANAVRVNYKKGSWSVEEFKRATIPNFAARCPVVLSISRTENGKRFGHAVVADGYGYSDGSFYIHVNFGWAGSSDAWYCPPELDDYTTIEGVVCNVFTSAIGSILSGRVLDSRGVPVAGATVKAFLDDGLDKEEEYFDVRDGKSAVVATGMTDSNGIYAFIIPTEGTYEVCATAAEMSAATNVAIAATTDSAIGNSHGNNIYLPGSTAQDITLDPQGGDDGTQSVLATYGSAMPAITPPTRKGYTFGGYWTAPNGGGTQYYTSSGASARNWNMTGATTLYAKWTINTYTIALNRSNGMGGSASVTVTYGSAMPAITLPTRTGYTFGGYYTAMGGGGTQYYTSSGASARNWDKTYAATLYAKWTANTYAMTLDRQGGSGGTATTTATYGAAMPPITPPTQTGYDFDGYYSEPNGGGAQYYNADGTSARAWDSTTVTTLYANWLVTPSPVFRFYSKSYKGHFFTIDETEKEDLRTHNPNWRYEGPAYLAFKEATSGTVALYRFYSKSYRGHFFTIDEDEMRTIRDTNPNWKYEGVAYYVYPSEVEGSVPVFRFWSKSYRHHFYTIDEDEKNNLVATNPNWKYETVAFWALPAESMATANGAGRAAADKSGTAGAEVAEVTGTTWWTGLSASPSLSDNADDGVCEAAAPWTLMLRNPCPGRVLAVPGVNDFDGIVVETGDEMSACLAILATAGKTDAAAAELRLKLPEGLFTAQLWRDAGMLDEQDVEGCYDFALSDSGEWHRLAIFDADGKEVFAIWLRAEK